MAEIQGKDIKFEISTDGGTTYKTLICLETLTVSFSSAVNERETRCGTKTGISPNKCTMTGTFVEDDAPAVTEVSGTMMRDWKNNNTLVDIKAVHITTPAKFFVQGDAYLTALDYDAPSDDVLSGNFTFNVSGVIDITP